MVHAEMDAMLGLGREVLKGADVYVYREIKDGSQAIAKPCPYCEAALRQVGIRNVYFTTDYGYETLNLKENQ
jgi:deoxycytidylate deaminase